MTFDYSCFAITCYYLVVTSMGVGFMWSGAENAKQFALVPGTLLRVGTCIPECMPITGGHKRRPESVYCSGVNFITDVSWQFYNDTFFAYNYTTFLPIVLGCETLGAGSQVTIELRVDSPGNITGLYQVGYTQSNGLFIAGCVFISISLCMMLILAVAGGFALHDKCKQKAFDRV
jgi:hypothetical protein